MDKLQDNHNIMQKSDEELVALTLANEENFLYLMNRYETKLLNYILKISNNSYEEAEDILQNVFIKVYKYLNDFDQSLKFSSWIYRITHNEVVSNYRKKKSRPQEVELDISQDHIMDLTSELDLNKEVDDKILRDLMKQLLKKIDLKYREVLILKFLEEKSYKEISDILKKPEGTVATLINRGKKILEKELEKVNY